MPASLSCSTWNIKKLEAVRHLRSPIGMQLTQDLRFASRAARQRPGFTAILLLALALGIGLTTSVFSVFYGVLLKPLPFRNPSRLVVVFERLPKLVPVPINMPPAAALEFGAVKAFESSAIFRSTTRNLGGDRPVRIDCLRASSSLLPLLGLSPAEGRNFTRTEEDRDAAVALISERLQLHRFGGRNVIGKTLLLDGKPYQVIGILPSQFTFPMRGMQQAANDADIVIPLSLTPAERSIRNDDYDFSLIARLADGVSLAEAKQAEQAVVNRLSASMPPKIREEVNLGVAVAPLKNRVVGDSRMLLLLLLGAAAALLLISCLNVSNLLLGRAIARRRELAVRSAIGASARRLLWQMLNESLLLFTVGGGLGLLCAVWSQNVLLRLLPADLPRTQDISINGAVLAFAFGVSLVSGLLFGLTPALASLRLDLAGALQEGSRSQSGGRSIGRTRRLLVISQITLAFVLLSGAGLLIRSFLVVLNQQSDLRSEHVLTFGLSLPKEQYPEITSVEAFDRELTNRLAALPATSSVGLGTDLPLEGYGGRLITLEHSESDAKPIVDYSDIKGDYFRSLGIRLQAGRWFDDHDRKNSERVAIVNRAFADAFWPGGSALGQRLKFGPPQSPGPWVRVVGIVADAHSRAADQAAAPHLFCPLDQEVYTDFERNVWFAVRSRGDALGLAREVRATVRDLDPTLPIVRPRTMEQVVSGAVAPRSANTWLVTVFALTALLLTVLGVYGVVAQSVAERTREIGIRMALGAMRAAVLRSVLWDGLRLVVVGIALGGLAYWAAAHLIRNLLFGVSSNDAITLAAVSAVLTIFTVLATLLPSWRAAHVDPHIALREQ